MLIVFPPAVNIPLHCLRSREFLPQNTVLRGGETSPSAAPAPGPPDRQLPLSCLSAPSCPLLPPAPSLTRRCGRPGHTALCSAPPARAPGRAHPSPALQHPWPGPGPFSLGSCSAGGSEGSAPLPPSLSSWRNTLPQLLRNVYFPWNKRGAGRGGGVCVCVPIPSRPGMAVTYVIFGCEKPGCAARSFLLLVPRWRDSEGAV